MYHTIEDHMNSPLQRRLQYTIRAIKSKLSMPYYNWRYRDHALPSFTIIGAQKGGTTSLFNYLIQHPKVVSPVKKELHFFHLPKLYPIGRYQSFFPKKKDLQAGQITGEATPCYLWNANTPANIKKYIPDVKMIILLRNPVERTLSQYYHTFNNGNESRSLEDALLLESLRTYRLQPRGFVQRYSYLQRSLYYEQLTNWFNYFPKEQFLILQSEQFYADPKASTIKTFEFIGIPEDEHMHDIEYRAYNIGKNKKEMSPTTRSFLAEYFQPHNEKLFELLGESFDWE